MIAELNPLNIRLDYTKVAKPLHPDDLANDITEVATKYAEQPDEIVLWEHQLDWLSKPYTEKGLRAEYWKPLQESLRRRSPLLFGVRIRLADEG